MSWFVDTNVLVYGVGSPEDRRRHRANEVIARLAWRRAGVISTQVLAEFSRVCLAKSTDLSHEQVAEHVMAFDERFRIVPLSLSVILEAIRGAAVHRLPYFDAQIWAAARLSQVRTILTEDFQDGRVIDGVRIVNPFSDDFDLARLG